MCFVIGRSWLAWQVRRVLCDGLFSGEEVFYVDWALGSFAATRWCSTRHCRRKFAWTGHLGLSGTPGGLSQGYQPLPLHRRPEFWFSWEASSCESELHGDRRCVVGPFRSNVGPFGQRCGCLSAAYKCAGAGGLLWTLWTSTPTCAWKGAVGSFYFPCGRALSGAPGEERVQGHWLLLWVALRLQWCSK
mmetsp:Transcript_75439/g.180224  ORF Transcript_75439/g.180224 Transcript_75439/m.180224 type:complete len:189 (+) Transcript_75439:195-761(+)